MKCSIGSILFTITFTFLSFTLLGTFDANAQNPVRDTLKTTIFFAKGKCELDKTRNGDFNKFKQFLDSISKLSLNNEAIIEKIIITGCASPEGSTDRNSNLANLRAEKVKDVLKLSLPDGIDYQIIPNAVWDHMLATLEKSQIANKKEIANVVVNTPEWIRNKSGKIVDGRKKRLTELNNGRAWREMLVVLFPMLRSATVEAVYKNVVKPAEKPVKQEEVKPAINVEKKEVKPEKVVKPKIKKVRKPFQMSFRTNLLYDIAMTPNIGAELYFGRNWSMGVNWMYAWWSNPKAAFFWRVYGGDVNIRKYFGRAAKRKQYTGHHIGIMGGMATYDFQLFGSKGILINDLKGNMPFNFFGGLEYGYAFPIGKRLNLDFTVGAGYFRADYFEYYHRYDESNWEATKRSRMFTPLKAEIALVWLIGKENINVRRRK